MTILVTGGDGYLGWPTSLRIASRTDQRVLLVDDFTRRRLVDRIGSESAVPIERMETRIAVARDELGVNNLSFVELDLTDRSAVDEVLAIHEPASVIHTAAQPSAPYSQVNGERANYTQHNNLQATRNLLWGLEENGLFDTHFVETTTTGIYGSPEFPIPEGGAVMEHRDDRDRVPFPALGGSWYHQTKAFDAANMRLAHTQFGLPISDVRTAIVYGTETEETRTADALSTRLDFDYYFGTVANRFCAQAVAGYPVSVYGKGEQRKPFVSLEDAVAGLAQLALSDPDDHAGDLTVYNQVTRAISIVEVAETIVEVAREYDLDVEVEYFENPRDEDETHQMEIENDAYLGLIGTPDLTFREGMADVLSTLLRYSQTVTAHQDRFLPDVIDSMPPDETPVDINRE